MYFGKSITVAVVSALSLVSSVLATPVERGGGGYYPAECSGFLIDSCTCNQGALALGFVAGVAAPVCISDVNVLNGNTIVIKHLL